MRKDKKVFYGALHSVNIPALFLNPKKSAATSASALKREESLIVIAPRLLQRTKVMLKLTPLSPAKLLLRIETFLSFLIERKPALSVTFSI